MDSMQQACYNALYVEFTPFQFVYFTKYETIRGVFSANYYGWRPHQPTTV